MLDRRVTRRACATPGAHEEKGLQIGLRDNGTLLPTYLSLFVFLRHNTGSLFSPWRQGQDYEFPDIFPKKDVEAAEEKPAASTAAQARPLEIEGVERIPEKGGNEGRTPPRT